MNRPAWPTCLQFDEFRAAFIVLVLMCLIALFAPTEEAYGQPTTFIDMTCKGAVTQNERGAALAGIRCEAKGILPDFFPRWSASNIADPSQPGYPSTQSSFFFPATDAWMVVDLRVQTPLDTVYLPRVKARRVHGKAELALYNANEEANPCCSKPGPSPTP